MIENFHKGISYLKSIIRIIGYSLLVVNNNILWGCLALIIAEVFGFIEEIEE